MGLSSPSAIELMICGEGQFSAFVNLNDSVFMCLARHARDLQANGAPLHTILAAGEWRSPAFLQYLDVNELEADAVVEAHMDESSGDDMC